MTRRIFYKVLLVVVAIFGLLVLSSVLLAQGRSEDAFDRVRDVQERNTDWLMAIEGVEGTAIGLGQGAQPVVLVLLEHGGVPGIPEDLEGVPVRPLVTGKIYALAPPNPPPGQDKKPPKDGDSTPPSAPTGLNATAVSSSEIDLDWDNNSEPDLSHYKVYRSTTSGGSYIRIASRVRSNAYSDTGLAGGTTYYYVVTAVDTSKNESAYSGEALAITFGETEEPPEEPLDPTSRWPRPVPIGVSTGHPLITAGTIGCRVIKADSIVYALSNNHVYANSNLATIGDNVLQPGPFDGGTNPADKIGTLADFEPIEFLTGSEPEPTNTIDAAIAEIIIDVVGGVDIPRVGNATPSDGYDTPKSTPAAPEVGMTVMKYGRTTGLTHGWVDGINATVRVRYKSGIARFVSQILIRPGGFSKGGDSGSLVITDPGKNPVGLLFAGGRGITIANPIDAVLDAFDVTVDGE